MRLFLNLSFYQTIHWGVLLFVVHTLLVARTIWFCYKNRKEGQVVLAWMLFIVIDFPAVPLFGWLLRGNAVMGNLSNWGYKTIGSGPNLTWAILTGIVGGGQWYFIGRCLDNAIKTHSFLSMYPAQ